MKKLMKTQVGRFAAGLVALLIVIAVSFGAKQLPALTADVTAQQVMSMSETALEIVRGLDTDVTISYIAAEDTKELWDNIGRNYRRVLKKEN